VCDWGRWSLCTAPQPTAEVCDNRDNNCDHFTDENLRRPCDTVCGPGNERCFEGGWRWCTARQPTAERCNYIDDDCDGEIDEDVGCWSTPYDPPADPPAPPDPDPPAQPDPDPPADPPADPYAEIPLPAPLIDYPPDGTVFEVPYYAATDWAIGFSWYWVPGVGEYEYVVSYASGPDIGVVAEEGRTWEEFFFFYCPPENYGIWFNWRVRAISGTDLPGEWSETRSVSFQEE